MDLHGLLMEVMILSPLLLLDIITLIHELREYLRVLRHGYYSRDSIFTESTDFRLSHSHIVTSYQSHGLHEFLL